MLAARGGERGFDAVPYNQNGRKGAEQVLPHGVEEAEVLSQQIADRLENELEIVGDHGNSGSLFGLGIFRCDLGHPEVLEGIGDRGGDLREIAGEGSPSGNVGVDGIGGGFALLFGSDSLQLQQRG